MATYPTPAQIDAAVPVDGTPSRALTNAALKAVSVPPTFAQVAGKPGLLTLVSAAPALPDSAGTPNQIFFDTDFLYICVATNTWRQIPLMGWDE